jgi:N-acyl-D-aspartate/D-glutamate deacylase
MGQANVGILQGVGGPGLGIPEWAQLSRHTGRPVTWCSLHQGVDGGRHWEYSRATAQAREAGANLWAQMTCMPNNAQFNLRAPYILNGVPAFGKIASLPHEERLRVLQDGTWQQEAQRQIDANQEKRSFQIKWDRVYLIESEVHSDLVGKTLSEIAGSRPPLEVLVELSRAEDLKTRFKVILFNFDEDEVARLLVQDSSLLGLGDAGAHASQICDSSFPMRLLGRFVRERKDFPLEYGVWRLTGHPAEVFGVAERGLLRQGFYADICVFDPETIGEGPEQRVFDLPAGADRLIKNPIGIEHVLVNGKFIRRSGQNRAGVESGRILRP